MKSHYCPEEKTIVAFEDQCNWCGEKESAKTLTDDEIVDIGTKFLAPKDCDIYTFARAILRKAQEK
jgi:hypothetical protein